MPVARNLLLLGPTAKEEEEMAPQEIIPRGLTKLILEGLVDAASVVGCEQALEDEQLLGQLRERLRLALAPSTNGIDRAFFELIFNRSFDEATRLLAMVCQMAAEPQAAGQGVS